MWCLMFVCVCLVCMCGGGGVACVSCVQWACGRVSLHVCAVSGRMGGSGPTLKVLLTQNPCC